MKQVAPAVRDLAWRLQAVEAGDDRSPDAKAQAGLRACEKLRVHLQTLVGAAGFQALLSRSLILAKSEVPWLNGVRVEAGGALQGFGAISPDQNMDAAAKGGEALLAQLIQLLVTFIGEALTLRLVRDIWPHLSLEDVRLSVEETP